MLLVISEGLDCASRAVRLTDQMDDSESTSVSADTPLVNVPRSRPPHQSALKVTKLHNKNL